jgi:hypothetical protein
LYSKEISQALCSLIDISLSKQDGVGRDAILTSRQSGHTMAMNYVSLKKFELPGYIFVNNALMDRFAKTFYVDKNRMYCNPRKGFTFREEHDGVFVDITSCYSQKQVDYIIDACVSLALQGGKFCLVFLQ